jgi:urea transport system permease protein
MSNATHIAQQSPPSATARARVPALHAPNSHKKIGAILLIASAAFLLFGVPALYAANTLDITSVNQLGRFLAVALVALGIDLVWGYSGILTLCQAMFFCFGGYAIGMHMALHGPLDGDHIPRCLFVVSSEISGVKLPWFWEPFQTLPLTLILGLFLPGLFAFIFSYFTFRSRVRGVYFSIITQAMTWALALVFSKNETKLCGTNGLTNFVTLAGFDLQSSKVKIGLYLLTVILLIIAYLLCTFIVRSRLGRLLIAVRDNESRLRFAGYQPVTFKVFVFVVGAVLAALGGMLYTPQNGIITPAKMGVAESVTLAVLVAVGGRSTLSGAVLGAVLVNYLGSILTTRWPALWPFFLGGLFIAVTLFIPDGLVGAWRKLLAHRADRAGVDADEASASAEDGSLVSGAALAGASAGGGEAHP